jgi:hypothetical protein
MEIIEVQLAGKRRLQRAESADSHWRGRHARRPRRRSTRSEVLTAEYQAVEAALGPDPRADPPLALLGQPARPAGRCPGTTTRGVVVSPRSRTAGRAREHGGHCRASTADAALIGGLGPPPYCSPPPFALLLPAMIRVVAHAAEWAQPVDLGGHLAVCDRHPSRIRQLRFPAGCPIAVGRFITA